ncbi:uncharacterized protein METZ01_LOCUS84206, partial [marine metagenome]
MDETKTAIISRSTRQIGDFPYIMVLYSRTWASRD